MADKSLHTKQVLGSKDDFGMAYEAHSRSIYRFFYWRTRDSQLSEDLTSNVFEKAWRSRSSFKGGSITAWLYRIASNLLIDHWRVKPTLPLAEEDTLSSGAEEIGVTLDKQIAADQLTRAISKLSPEMRQVVMLRFMEDFSARQVAKKLGTSEGNVRVIQYRALKQIRKHLDENHTT